MTTAEAVRSMLLLMPRLVGRAKRLPIPAVLRGLDLAPRHLALLAYLQYDGPLTISELAARLEVAPTTVSLMVGDLSRHGVLTRAEDDTDRRRRIVAIAPGYAAPITQWLSGSAAAWTEALDALTPSERATIVATMRAYEAALDKHGNASSTLGETKYARERRLPRTPRPRSGDTAT
jgi:DNA-binding MarR family transcriptional regulator